MSNGFILKELSAFIIGILIAIFLFPGCIFMGYGNMPERQEEKKIFGFLDGYNHRIKEAQGYLKNAGFDPSPIDGTMGRRTRKSIRDFQKENGLKVTGFIDSKTWERLSDYKDLLRYYLSSTEGIKKIQSALEISGFDPGPIDGKMGLRTKNAIVKFQAAKGLTPNGRIDSETLENLKQYFSVKK